VPVGETTNFISGDDNCSDGHAITEHRHRKNTPPTTRHRNFACVLRISQHVLNLRHLAGEDRSTGRLVRLRGSPIHPLHDFDHLGRKMMEGDDMNQVAIKPVHRAHTRVAETHSVYDDRVEDRLEVKARVADDFKDFGTGRLLLKRLVALASTAVELFLQVGSGYVCGRRFVRLGPSYALPLHRLSASTASLHVAP